MKNRSTLLLCALLAGLLLLQFRSTSQQAPDVVITFTNTPRCYLIQQSNNMTNWYDYLYVSSPYNITSIYYQVKAGRPQEFWRLIPTNCYYGH